MPQCLSAFMAAATAFGTLPAYDYSMIRHSRQSWLPGATVRVGFLTLRVISVRAVVDGLPDIYTLTSLDGTRYYDFTPHVGLARIDAPGTEETNATL